MLIYRVQNADGHGPFYGSSRGEYDKIGHCKDDAVWYDGPAPQNEAFREDRYDFDMLDGRVCGVERPALLEEWFPIPEALALLDYSLTVWEVDGASDDVDPFWYQVTFKPATAERLATLPIGETWAATLAEWQKARV